MTATLAELLAELENDPAGTDFVTMEQVLRLANYTVKERGVHLYHCDPPNGGIPIVLRRDMQFINPDVVRMWVAMIRRDTSQEGRVL